MSRSGLLADRERRRGLYLGQVSSSRRHVEREQFHVGDDLLRPQALDTFDSGSQVTFLIDNCSQLIL